MEANQLVAVNHAAVRVGSANLPQDAVQGLMSAEMLEAFQDAVNVQAADSQPNIRGMNAITWCKLNTGGITSLDN